MIATSTNAAFRTLVSNDAHTLDADTTAANGGAGNGLRPHDLLEAAVAACMNITARMVAAEEGIDLSGVEVRVELDRTDPRRTAFRSAIELRGDLSDDERGRIADAVQRCPVRQTLSKELCFVEDD